MKKSNTLTNLVRNFSTIPIDYSWSFADKTSKDTNYITHGYYTYPAKFIPQLAARLILENSNEEEVVLDPFMGSATTIVESIVNNRKAVGVDINEIAYLVALVKTTPIEPKKLLEELNKLEFELSFQINRDATYLNKALEKIPNHERIDYWFLPEQKEKLSLLFARILEIQHQEIQNFFLVAFAQILKSCSIWLQKSVKPMRDLNKKFHEPKDLFLTQAKKMIEKHIEFYELLPSKVKKNIDKYRTIQCGDSRELPASDESVSLIVTSPPYVTSYEYADLHQLPSLWFGYLKDLSSFRKKFIGSAYKERESGEIKSSLLEEILSHLKDKKKAKEVKNYFTDMQESFLEMKRVLKPKGLACIVIGNTEFRGVSILNAEVFQEQMENLGFGTHSIIHREIPSKMLPSTRDAKTGKFVKVEEENLKLAYPTEYILIMEKK